MYPARVHPPGQLACTPGTSPHVAVDGDMLTPPHDLGYTSVMTSAWPRSVVDWLPIRPNMARMAILSIQTANQGYPYGYPLMA